MQSEPKRLKVSSGRSVCFIVHCWHESFEEDKYKFYIVDRDSYSDDDEFVHMTPTLEFHADCAAVAFCALNSTIYMFEGDFLGSRSAGQYAGKFQITPEIARSHRELVRNDGLVPIGPMCERKYSPIALPTPDGKHILVFSSQFTWRRKRDEIYGDSFELYNVDDNSWTLCGRLPREGDVSSRYGIVVYGFEGESHFVIKISSGLVFVLDLQTRTWNLKRSCNPQVRGPYFIGIDEFHFTPRLAYDNMRRIQLPLQPPLSTFPDRDKDNDDAFAHLKDRRGFYPYMALLGYDERDGGGVYDLGVVQARRPPSSADCVNVILDVYSVDISKFRRDVEQHESDTKKYYEEYKEKHEEKLKGKKWWEYARKRDEKQPPWFETTIATKSFKRQIDFDFGTYLSGQVYLFSI